MNEIKFTFNLPNGLTKTFYRTSAEAPTNEAPTAQEKAENYLNSSAYSRSGLIEQLVYGGFSEAEAEHGVNAVQADWFQQAALSAESALDSSEYSRGDLLEYLVFEGFSQAEAEHGVSAVGP